MSSLVILVVEDEPGVRDAVIRDLESFEPLFRIEPAEDATDAKAALEECAADGVRVALIVADHLLPGQHGTEFLIEVNQSDEGKHIKKVLLTGQAGHDDTIRAINQAGLDYYVAKPWSGADLISVVSKQLTDYVLEESGDLLPYVSILDGSRLLEAIAERGI
ncbi:MAG: response regulator [bacterium]|nr:response regulator [bacterium]